MTHRYITVLDVDEPSNAVVIDAVSGASGAPRKTDRTHHTIRHTTLKSLHLYKIKKGGIVLAVRI